MACILPSNHQMNTILKLQNRLPHLFPQEETQRSSNGMILAYKRPDLFEDSVDSLQSRPWLPDVDQASFRSIANFITKACGNNPEFEDLRTESECLVQTYQELEDEHVALELALEQRLDALCAEQHKRLESARKLAAK